MAFLVLAYWLFVLQPLARRAVDHGHYPVSITHFAMLPSEAEFVAVTAQVLLAQLVENSVMPAFQQGKERFRLTKEEQADCEKAADKAGVKVSAWIRERLVRCAKRELKN